MTDTDWDRTVFALITPDALTRHLGLAVLDRIQAAGFAPVAWRVLWHRPADLDAFHEHNIAHAWQAYRYRLVDQLFALGPTVALLLADQRPGADDGGHQRLTRAKGPSDPVRSQAGTIRGDLGSVNVVLALMHCSDSPADSAAESAVFTGDGGFRAGPGSAGGDVELRQLLALLQLATPKEARGYPGVLAGLRARLLAAAWPELPGPVRKTAATMLESGAGPELAAAGSGARLAALLPDGHPLAGLLEADFTPGSPGPDPQRARLAIAPYGVTLDAWEALVLATSRRFWPRGTTKPVRAQPA